MQATLKFDTIITDTILRNREATRFVSVSHSAAGIGVVAQRGA